jgi:hypothetical protein
MRIKSRRYYEERKQTSRRDGVAIPVVRDAAHAQIVNGVDFTTSFPFYAGNAKMPAGSYKITQSDMDIDASILQIQSKDGVHSALVEFIPTHSAQPHPHSDVTFHKYGDTEYLNRVWVEGQEYGMKVDPTKAETKAAANANVVEHSLSASLR